MILNDDEQPVTITIKILCGNAANRYLKLPYAASARTLIIKAGPNWLEEPSRMVALIAERKVVMPFHC